MRRINAFDRLMYVLNPKKSLHEFMNEAENCVREYALHSFGVNRVPKIHTIAEYPDNFSCVPMVRKTKNYRRINIIINSLLAFSSVAAAYLIYRFIM